MFLTYVNMVLVTFQITKKQIFRFFFRTYEVILVDHSFPSAIDHSCKGALLNSFTYLENSFYLFVPQ